MRAHLRGFSLTELAVVLFIVALLLGTAMFTMNAQTEVRGFDETRRRLDAARELVLAYAVVNGRLPCPATGGTGVEVRDIATGQCTGGYFGGFLPARTIGFQITDDNGFGLDAWNGRIRYAVSAAVDNITVPSCTGASANHFTNATSLRANGLTCSPNDLIICKSSAGVTAAACGNTPANDAANQVTAPKLVVAIVFSTGKNALSEPLGNGNDEQANLNGADPVFVFHTPTPTGPANGSFDDHMVWITAGELYGKLIAAGVLP